jgi:hypothetical protein
MKLRTRSMAISGVISIHGSKCRDFLQRSQLASSAETGHIRA